MTLADVRDFSRRLRAIRNKALVHIDKAGVFDPRKIYKDAGIKNSDVDKTIRALWAAMQDLYQTALGQAYRRDSYSGADITLLEKCRNEISQRA